MKTIVQQHKDNFETLRRAFLEGNVCLMECTDKITNKKVAVICAVNISAVNISAVNISAVSINGELEMVPMAMFFNENPYDRLTPPMEQPRYKHDCKDCEFLGQYKKYDLYFCLNGPTIVARWSNKEYGSGLVFGITSTNNQYTEAIVRALRAGHKQKIIDYFKEYHYSMLGNKQEKFEEILLISETDPKDYPTLIGNLKYFSSYIEEYFKGEESNETSD